VWTYGKRCAPPSGPRGVSGVFMSFWMALVVRAQGGAQTPQAWRALPSLAGGSAASSHLTRETTRLQLTERREFGPGFSLQRVSNSRADLVTRERQCGAVEQDLTNLAVCAVEGEVQSVQSRVITTLRLLSGTIAGMRSRLTRASDRPTIDTEREHVTMRLRVLAACTCYLCGGTVEDGLARLGSTLCHDCRRGSVVRGSARM
jgi:hypothetical protein